MDSLAVAFPSASPSSSTPFDFVDTDPPVESGTRWCVPAQPVAIPSPLAEDAALVQSLIAGNAGAWRTFETRYGRLILSCISRVTSRFACVRADDVREIQATLYLELLSNDKRKLRSFEPERGTRFGTWLGLLATHTAYDFLRRARRDSKCDGIEGAETLRAETPDPSDYTLVRERAALVSRLLQTLSDKDRQFVELYYGEGLEPEEVARRMQISVKTVYTKKHKLRGRLESLLEDVCDAIPSS